MSPNLAVLEVLLEIRDTQPWTPDTWRAGRGICWYLVTKVQMQYGIPSAVTSLVLNDLFAQWPDYSGAVEYPVPHPTMPPKDAFHSLYTEGLWDPETEYGRSRLALLAFMIEKLEGLNSDPGV